MNAPVTILPRRKRAKLTVEDYLALDGRGAFDRYGKTELLDGEVFYMNAQHRPHARVKTRLVIELTEALRGIGGLEAVVEGSIEIPPHSVPEPDIVVTSEAEGEGLIPLASVRLVIEVADSTVNSDLKSKLRLYAAAGVPEYWVVDLPGAKLHQFWQPQGKAFFERREIALGGAVAAATIIGLTVATSSLA